MIRVLVVDDSLTARKIIAARLAEVGIEVAGEAENGAEAVELVHRLRPDVVLMDVVMPVLDGLAATERIMSEVPMPIVILSGHADSQETFKVFDALAIGALEVCSKPASSDGGDSQAWEGILRTVRAAARVPVIKLQRPGTAQGSPPPPRRGSGFEIVVLGGSTGGPSALLTILRNLPADYPLPILVAIHSPRGLPSSMAGWLDRECPLPVADARDGQHLADRPATVLLPPPGRNLTVGQGRTFLGEPGEGGHAPSVDALFASAAGSCGAATIGVLLTGMGRDGAEGLGQIHDRGGCTIAQDEASSVVFGMPGAAITLGAVDRVLPLEGIPGRLIELARGFGRASA